jgi:hypothetical protein
MDVTGENKLRPVLIAGTLVVSDFLGVVGGEKVGHGSGGVVLLRGARKGSQWLA